MRPRCSVYIAVSLDGFIAREDGSIDWLSQVEMPGEDYGYRAFMDSVDAVVLGRRTYDQVLSFPAWPFDGKRCVVLTRRPLPQPRHGETSFEGPPEALLDTLADLRRAYVDGGDVIRQFLAAGLVDDLTLSVVPLLLGRGRPLFGAMPVDRRLRLLASSTFGSGLVQLRYGAAE